jgi:hypothetical protein
VLWYNTSANPRLGSWSSINIATIANGKFGYDYSNEYETNANPVLAVASGTIGGTTWTVVGLGDGQVLTTSDFSTWYGAVPKPFTFSIASYNDTDPGTELVLDWDENENPDENGDNVSQVQPWYSGKVTITTTPGGDSAIPPGTY